MSPKTKRNPRGAGRKPLTDPRQRESTTLAQSAIAILESAFPQRSMGHIIRTLVEACARGLATNNRRGELEKAVKSLQEK